MAKPKGVYQKKKYNAHFKRVESYIAMVRTIYEMMNIDMAKVVVATAYDGSKPFLFSDFPEAEQAFVQMQKQFVTGMRNVVYTGTSAEWEQSNLIQDLLVDKTMAFYGVQVDDEKRIKYYQKNSEQLKAFQNRRRKGMNLSDRIWRDMPLYRHELETAISIAVQKGTSAVKLSKQISKYLLDYPRLKKDYVKKYGHVTDCLDCEYRSIRLARTEINMAYRSAEQARWNQLDFVLGYEIKITHSHKHVYDICDELKGVYPKTFKFLGWHPNCMCYVVPVLKTEAQFFGDVPADMIENVPDNFSKYLKDNADRIKAAKKRGTLPYWYLDNKKYISAA